jgi:hypothetical protein
MDKKPQHHCSKGHTIPIRGYCDLMNCRDYTPSAGNVCEYLDIEPSPDPRDGNEAQELVNEAVEPSPKDKKIVIINASQEYGLSNEDLAKELGIAPQPEPMPLIENIYQATLITGFAFTEGCKQQRDADMAWHLEKVQQVRKDFAEEYIKTMRKVGHKNGAIPNTVPYAEGAEKQFEVCIAHLRAMAGGVSDGT